MNTAYNRNGAPQGGMPPGSGFKISLVPQGAWANPAGALFGKPGQVYTDTRSPYIDYFKTVQQLQKEAFLGEMCVQEKGVKSPFAMGMTEEEYFEAVVVPCGIIVFFMALIVCTIITRIRQGKGPMPFGSCEGYESIVEDGSLEPGDQEGPGRGEMKAETTPAADGGQPPGTSPYIWSPPPPAFRGEGKGVSGSVKVVPAAGKEPLPYERIPTPGAPPYLWSPPPTIFQPSPTPAGTPFMASPGGAPSPGESLAVTDNQGLIPRKNLQYATQTVH